MSFNYNTNPKLPRFVIPIINNRELISLEKEYANNDLLQNFLMTTHFKEIKVYTRPRIDDDMPVLIYQGNPKYYFV